MILDWMIHFFIIIFSFFFFVFSSRFFLFFFFLFLFLFSIAVWEGRQFADIYITYLLWTSPPQGKQLLTITCSAVGHMTFLILILYVVGPNFRYRCEGRGVRARELVDDNNGCWQSSEYRPSVSFDTGSCVSVRRPEWPNALPAQLGLHRFQTVARLVWRIKAGHLHPLGRVFRAQLLVRVVLVELEGTVDSCHPKVYAGQLPARLYVYRLCQTVHHRVLRCQRLGRDVWSLWRQVSPFTQCRAVFLLRFQFFIE